MSNRNSHTALVTGASRGLGLALARALARQNWQLVIDARGAGALEQARTELARLTTVRAIAGDVTEASHRRALVQAAAELGGLDALVNNAGILGPSPQPPLLDYPLEVLQEVFRANTLAPLALIQAARPLLKPGARIINVTSHSGRIRLRARRPRPVTQDDFAYTPCAGKPETDQSFTTSRYASKVRTHQSISG